MSVGSAKKITVILARFRELNNFTCNSILWVRIGTVTSTVVSFEILIIPIKVDIYNCSKLVINSNYQGFFSNLTYFAHFVVFYRWPIYIHCPFLNFHNRIENVVLCKVQLIRGPHDNDNYKPNKCLNHLSLRL